MQLVLPLEGQLALRQLSHGRGLLEEPGVDPAQYPAHPFVQLGAGEFAGQEIGGRLGMAGLDLGDAALLFGHVDVRLRRVDLRLADRDVLRGDCRLRLPLALARFETGVDPRDAGLGLGDLRVGRKHRRARLRRRAG